MKPSVLVLSPVGLAVLLACTPAEDAPAVESTPPPAPAAVSEAVDMLPAARFLGAIASHCGQSFAGRVVSTDPLDAGMASQRLVMTVASCSPDEVRMTFQVGPDASRTWVVSRTETGLRLKHDHRHADGTEDVLSQYGGDTLSGGTAVRQEFPADAFSKALFQREGGAALISNVWAMEVNDALFAYELRRPDRFFRVEFDLTRAVEP